MNDKYQSKKEVRGDVARTLDKFVDAMHDYYGAVMGDTMCQKLSALVLKFEQYDYDVERYRDAVTFYGSAKNLFDDYYLGFKRSGGTKK